MESITESEPSLEIGYHECGGRWTIDETGSRICASCRAAYEEERQALVLEAIGTARKILKVHDVYLGNWARRMHRTKYDRTRAGADPRCTRAAPQAGSICSSRFAATTLLVRREKSRS